MDGGGEALIGFIVTCRDASVLLEPLEAVLDEMSPFVHLGVVRNRGFAVRLGRYDGIAPRSFNWARSLSLSKALSAISASKSMSWISGSVPMLSWR
jgi:hypothetical protein